MSRGKVVFVSRQRLVGSINGSSAYLLDIADTVRTAGFELHLLQPTPRVAGRWPVLRMRPEMEVFTSHRIRGLLRVGSNFVSLSPQVWLAATWGMISRMARKFGLKAGIFADRPFGYIVAEDWSYRDRRWLARATAAIGGREIRAIIADYMFCTPACSELPGDVPVATIMHDLFHARAGDGGDTVAIVGAEQEKALLGAGSAVLAIQATEAAWVAENVPDTEVLLTPMAARIANAPTVGADDRLLFVGSNTGPNIVGLRWFLDEVWPLVRAARPAAELDVAGTVAWSLAGREDAGVRFLGMVDDLAPLYRDAGVVVSPLTFGSGLKIKLVEAMAIGKAIVATPITLQGLEDLAGDGVIRADQAREFAQAVIRLTGDSCAREALAVRALEVAGTRFGRESSHADFAAWLGRAASMNA